MKKLEILILDDQIKGAKVTERSLRAGPGKAHRIRVVAGEDLRKLLESFWDHIAAILRKEATQLDFKGFGSADIAFVDDNLTLLPRVKGGVSSAPLSAESIIGYLRAFTSIPFIVSLNRDVEVDFDLTALVGDRTSIADLAINSTHLSYQALWQPLSSASTEFAPSYWPLLTEAPMRRRKAIDHFQRKPTAQLLGLLGIDTPKKINAISDRALGALMPTYGRTDATDGWQGVTIGEYFLHACRSLPTDVLRQFKDNPVVVSRVASSEIEGWLRRDLLAPQDAIVTVPHLIARMPFLLGSKVSLISNWNQAASARKAPFGINPNYYNKHLRSHSTGLESWLGVQTFWWSDVNDEPALLKLYSEAKGWGDFVYCEDISRFRARGRGGKIREFSADFEGSWRHRFVSHDGDGYLPKVRFAT